MEATTAAGLRLSAPEFHLDPQFVVWLNNGEPKFTWHRSGAPSEYSDVVGELRLVAAPSKAVIALRKLRRGFQNTREAVARKWPYLSSEETQGTTA